MFYRFANKPIVQTKQTSTKKNRVHHIPQDEDLEDTYIQNTLDSIVNTPRRVGDVQVESLFQITPPVTNISPTLHFKSTSPVPTTSTQTTSVSVNDIVIRDTQLYKHPELDEVEDDFFLLQKSEDEFDAKDYRSLFMLQLLDELS